MRLCLLVLHYAQKLRASPHFLSPFELWKKPLSNFHIGSIVVAKLSFLFWKNESWSHCARPTKKNPRCSGDFSKEVYPVHFEGMSIMADIEKNQNFLSCKHLHKFPLSFSCLFPHFLVWIFFDFFPKVKILTENYIDKYVKIYISIDFICFCNDFVTIYVYTTECTNFYSIWKILS